MQIKQGNCAICGKHTELTFEHIPPKCAFNDKLIFVQKHDHLFETKSYLYGKKQKSHKGQGLYSLCQSCNNNTGDWYSRDYCDFAQQGLTILTKQENPNYIEGQYMIKPLNVFKQIITMFMSADRLGYLQSKKELVNFILNKSSNLFPDNLRVFIYSNASHYKRLLGYCSAYDEILGIQKWSEINFKPFGYILAEDSGPANENMVEITDFSKFNYDKRYQVNLTTAYLKVSSPIIGMYG